MTEKDKMTMTKKVSVIIPVYNAEKYLNDCLESVFNQDYNNLEIICVNDGSTDNSQRILEKYRNQYPYVFKLLYQNNSGAPAARNLGIKAADGEYLYFFDADDIMSEKAISNLVSAAEEYDSDITVGNYMIIPNKIVKNVDYIHTLSKRNLFLHNNRFLCSAINPLPGNKLFKRELVIDNKIMFSPINVGQDLNFYLKCLFYANSICLCNDVVFLYRIVYGSISRQYSIKILDIIKCFDELKSIYKTEYRSYEKYVSLSELIAYRTQLNKVRMFNVTDDKPKAKNSLLQAICNIRTSFSVFTFQRFKEYIKILLIILKGE